MLKFWTDVLKRLGCTPKQKATVGTRVYFESLQSRVLLSAGVEGAFVDTVSLACEDFAQAPLAAEIAFLEEAQGPALLDLSAPADPNAGIQTDLIDATGMRELVFFDDNLADNQHLIADLQRSDSNRNIEVVVLESDRNGIEQVSKILSERSNLTAVHFISHGADGQINLGNTWLNNTTLQENRDAVAGWGNALTETGDILFYGCNIAAGSDGQRLLDDIAELTGADVAGSNDATGNQNLGGDWQLETNYGQIETALAPSATFQQHWDGLLATYTVTNTNDSGANSLRQAITDANANAGADTITFNITGSGPHTIMPNSALPAITDAVIIDGWSEPDFAGAPVIVLNGTIAGAGTDGLSITSGGVTIRGLVINRFGGDGIQITGAGGNVIQGNYLGTNVSGNAGLGNGFDGIRIDNSANNVIGGTTAQTRNIISGNNIHGVRLIGSAAVNNTVQGNYIGLNAAGTGARGNTYNGIWIAPGASNNLIGGTAPGAGNVISGNNYSGVNISGLGTDNNLIQGNFIGTAADGSSPLGNTSFGVLIWNGPRGNQIGGAASGAGNVIANNGSGVIVDANPVNSVDNAILGNRIFGNVTLGIDLYPAGVRANDLGDGDSGPNNYQNYPVLVDARTNGTQINLAGTLNSTANTSFRIEFFASFTGDASGYGEAERFLGFVNVTTDGAGNAGFDTLLTAGVDVGESISATATRADAGFTTFFDTSEFGLNRTATLLNSAPVNILPGPITATEDTTLAIPGLSVSDVDGNLSSVQLSVANGALTLSLAGGATISSGANNSASVTLAGTQAQLNAALATLTYQGNADFNGTDTLTVLSTDGAALSDTDNLAITVNPVNDAPLGVPTITGTATEDQVLTADVSGISDADGLGAFSYQWLRDGVDIAGATGSSYTLGDADVGTQISVQVSYTDAQGTAESLTSAQTAAVAHASDPATAVVPNVSDPGTEETGGTMVTIDAPLPGPADIYTGEDSGPLQDTPLDPPPSLLPELTDRSLSGGGKAVKQEEPPEEEVSETDEESGESSPTSTQPSENTGAPSSPPEITVDVPSSGLREESLPGTEVTRDERPVEAQKPEFRPEGPHRMMQAGDYGSLRDSLDALKQEMAKDIKLSKVYLGSALVTSIGLSVGYVVWLLRGGMLLASLLSSMPAWQFLDPLPILARKRDDDHSEDNESLESMVDQNQDDPKEKTGDPPTDAEVKRR